MDFVFICPETHQTFNCGHFKIIENYRVKTDSAGNKYLDAKVRLDEPCPFCGKRHVYSANELSCPFLGRTEGEGKIKGGKG